MDGIFSLFNWVTKSSTIEFGLNARVENCMILVSSSRSLSSVLYDSWEFSECYLLDSLIDIVNFYLPLYCWFHLSARISMDMKACYSLE